MFGDRLRLARKKAGLSLQALSERVSPAVSAQAISKYESGKMMPSSSVLVGLGKALVNGGVKPGHWAVQNPASTAGTQASAGRA